MSAANDAYELLNWRRSDSTCRHSIYLISI